MAPPLTLSPPPPQAWAREAARLPLAFAQVREDPRLDLEIVAALPPNSTVCMIASGGETAVCLGRHANIARLHLVDMNPAQLALSRLKWHLAGHASVEEAVPLLGHEPMEPGLRAKKLARLLETLALPEAVFGPPELVAELGPDHAGRYEQTFARLREVLYGAQTSGSFLDSPSIVLPFVCQSPLPQKRRHVAALQIEAAFASVMSLENLVCLFGGQATQNPARPFHEHFAARLRLELSRRLPARNPFLWQILAGRFSPGHRYDWLQPASSQRPLLAQPCWHHGRMTEVLDSLPAGSVDMVHLSNILDWLNSGEAQKALASASRVLKPGGRLIIRQLNSSLNIPGLPTEIRWDAAQGVAMEAADRSFFYPFIHVGAKPSDCPP